MMFVKPLLEDNYDRLRSAFTPQIGIHWRHYLKRWCPFKCIDLCSVTVARLRSMSCLWSTSYPQIYVRFQSHRHLYLRSMSFFFRFLWYGNYMMFVKPLLEDNYDRLRSAFTPQISIQLNEPVNNKNSLFVSLYSISLALAFRNIENFKDVSQLSIFSYK
jgi:hypothetical protein